MENTLQRAIQTALPAFGKVSGRDVSDVQATLLTLIYSDKPFMRKVEELDEVFDDEPTLEALREVFFDLLLINFFSEDVNKLEEDYLDSPEWEAIEDKTIDRGTELLNVLLYLKECEDERIEPELGDFLKEFLLVDEDEFQDEHRIYEDVIANQILMESNFAEIARVANELPATSEIKELFYSLMCFFNETNPSAKQKETFLANAPEPELDIFVYTLLTSYINK